MPVWSGDDLDVVDAALRRLLVKQEEEEQGRISEQATGGDQVHHSGLLKQLIEEVHILRLEKSSGNECESKPVQSSRGEVGEADTATIAVKAALAAANAAQAAADSVAKTSRIMELVFENMHSQRAAVLGDGDVIPVNSSSTKDVVLAKAVKDLRRQNTVTHCLLGVMVLATALWRFKEISWIIKLRKVLDNPLEAVGVRNPLEGVFGSGSGGGAEQQPKVEAVEPKLQLPHLELPQIFHKSEKPESPS